MSISTLSRSLLWEQQQTNTMQSMFIIKWELIGGVDGVCGRGEAFGGSDGGDGDKFDCEGEPVGGLATSGAGEFVGGVNTSGGGGELLGGLDTGSDGGNELIGGLDAIGDGGGGRHELVGGLDTGGDGGGDVGGCARGDGVGGVERSHGFALGLEGVEKMAVTMVVDWC
ncbi:ctenidin-1-like [Pistacia vera]|uniref:ctenidin-1-like n=1 Tax=Pistacia vera TaxID=55513 RepID=UPI001262B6D9|nr:ctenidin-1-like [Pistacia vera]